MGRRQTLTVRHDVMHVVVIHVVNTAGIRGIEEEFFVWVFFIRDELGATHGLSVVIKTPLYRTTVLKYFVVVEPPTQSLFMTIL